jgi:hypothetical protein
MDKYDWFWPYGNNCVAIAVAMGQQVIRLDAHDHKLSLPSVSPLPKLSQEGDQPMGRFFCVLQLASVVICVTLVEGMDGLDMTFN